MSLRASPLLDANPVRTSKSGKGMRASKSATVRTVAGISRVSIATVSGPGTSTEEENRMRLAASTARTVSAFQQFPRRMADYPIRLELLSRFRTKREQASVIKDLAAGAVDIVIGTHRIVQDDIAFKDLGLVVIDEGNSALVCCTRRNSNACARWWTC